MLRIIILAIRPISPFRMPQIILKASLLPRSLPFDFYLSKIATDSTKDSLNNPTNDRVLKIIESSNAFDRFGR